MAGSASAAEPWRQLGSDTVGSSAIAQLRGGLGHPLSLSDIADQGSNALRQLDLVKLRRGENHVAGTLGLQHESGFLLPRLDKRDRGQPERAALQGEAAAVSDRQIRRQRFSAAGRAGRRRACSA